LSEGRFAVLLLLRQSPSKLAPSELAEQAGVTRATMTGLLDGLVRDGFVNREETKNDRRSFAVSLTPKGRRVVEKVIPLQLKWLEALFADLTLGAKKNLLECLQMIGRKVQHEKQ
jgi:DNA-binding MarR family transcriptional regulator